MNILAIWVVGIVLTIRCAWEIGCLRIPKEKKLMAIVSSHLGPSCVPQYILAPLSRI